MLRKIPFVAAAALIIAASAYGAIGGSLPLGPSSMSQEKTFLGFYDGHHDLFVATDTSNKAQATAMGINFSKQLGTVKGAPDQYFIEGKAAKGQISVFGSEPGEPDYNPLWDEEIVTWKAGAKPVLLKSDNQINSLEKKGQLTVRDSHIVLNAPILKIEK